ncbi:MAG: Fe-S oxidoreductase [Nitrosomonadales bacterium]|jgi:glycerol-3-phosphate dehydrogenase subunit C|nr:Fe-S oxidoreductase [Nitrosomonadales bacterium]
MTTPKEGSLEAPTRHPIDWKNPDYFNEDSLNKELERVFDICHGCRRCVNLCQSFPALFDLVDESPTLEVDGIKKEDFTKVVDECYLCDMCYMTKCPYVPPHEWNVDFPHLMLRAKAIKYKKGDVKLRDKILTSTDNVGKFVGIPIIAQTVNVVNKVGVVRKSLEIMAGIHSKAWLPKFESNNLRKRLKNHQSNIVPESAGKTTGKVALFATCFMNRNEPGPAEDLVVVFEHNKIQIRLTKKETCCAIPKLELGNLEEVEKAKNVNIPLLAELVDEGWDLTSLIPSCVLMFKQELPLMFPDEPDVIKVKNAFYDPFEYLMLRNREDKFLKDFKQGLGKVTYHAACHQRVQNIGPKTKETLSLIPDTTVESIERCSGHDGTYAVKKESHAYAMKIVKPIVSRINESQPDHYGSDCAMAGHHISHARNDGSSPEHPMTLLRKAYQI